MLHSRGPCAGRQSHHHSEQLTTKTQTDWEWVEQTLTDSCQVQSELEKFKPKALVESQTVLEIIVIGPDSELLWKVNRKIDVGPHPPFVSKQEKRAAKEQAEQRLLEWGLQRVQNTGNQNRFFSGGGQLKTISYRLSNEVWIIREKHYFPQMDIRDSSDIFTFQGETERQNVYNLCTVIDTSFSLPSTPMPLLFRSMDRTI
ncbi:hypothetical protein J4Q44_G00371310 [Coregonus suidteri]|uniref:Uncharacterized protein n=1 Tax=Coregonus suidteri TaxID=861788 RepID=A0AAN8KHG6_9TELE